ncbi:MAG: bifunctional folylpolyglutamate synthase/dihydrofolate synthase [Candidatus Eisenbacteria bacterium]|nr:bifunctional folylpolyglutamate synthase/dihydrofolate synthase [Candidatus Eisenbacteria bacterium]
MTYAEALEKLYRLEHSGIKLGLDRIAAAVRQLGDPHRAYATIHVAGTNGKGSTSALFARMLQENGYRTGLYTSPHLLDFRERIRVDGEMAAESEIVAGLEEIWPAVERHQLSFFEAATCLAFWIFARREVAAAVLEVGLGGRLDATNVVAPALTVITSLALDHQKTLGSGLRRIAGEKAGILKPEVPLVLATCAGEARAVVLDAAAARNVPVHLDRDALAVRDLEIDWCESRWRGERRAPGWPEWFDGAWRVSLAGAHQVENARLALVGAALLERGGWRIAPAGLRRALAATHWPGRIESLAPRRPVILDVAHNVEGARRLVRTLTRFPGWRGARWVVGMVQGKDHRAFLRELSRAGRRFHLCAPAHHRCVPAGVLEEAAAGLSFATHANVSGAVAAALQELQPGEICVVSGSFFTLDEACRVLGVVPRVSLGAAPAEVV